MSYLGLKLYGVTPHYVPYSRVLTFVHSVRWPFPNGLKLYGVTPYSVNGIFYKFGVISTSLGLKLYRVTPHYVPYSRFQTFVHSVHWPCPNGLKHYRVAPYSVNILFDKFGVILSSLGLKLYGVTPH